MARREPMSWNELGEGACADLAPQVVEKYFTDANLRDAFILRTSRAICSRCVVVEECRTEAFNSALNELPNVIAGVTSGEYKKARSWRLYELGERDTPPHYRRPDWLARPEAVEMVESVRVDDEQLEGAL